MLPPSRAPERARGAVGDPRLTTPSRTALVRWLDPTRAGALFFLLVANLAACLLLFAWQSGTLLHRVRLNPSTHDYMEFLLYCSTLGGSACLAAFALACVVARWVPRRAMLIAVAAVSGVFVFAVFLDAKLYSWIGMHLYDRAVVVALRESEIQGAVHASGEEIASIVGSIAVLVGLERVAARACARAWDRTAATRRGRALATLVLGVACGVVVSAWGSRNLLRRTRDGGDALASIAPLHDLLFEPAIGPRAIVTHDAPRLAYPTPPKRTPTMTRRPDILFVAVESLRADALTEARMPNVARFAAGASCVRSAHHHSGSHVTQLGLFSMLYGLDTYYYDAVVNEGATSYPLDVLKANGYVVAGACSAPIANWGDAAVMTKQLAPYVEFDGERPWQRDQQLESWAEETHRARDVDRPEMIFLFFDSTHNNYSYPPDFEKNVPTVPEDANRLFVSESSPDLRASIRNRYDNSVLYVDSLFARLMRAFDDDWRRGNLVVVLTGDHAEEIWDEGALGHGSPQLIASRTQVPLVLCTPGDEGHEVALSSHVDLWPTILDYARLTPPVDPRTYSNGVSLLGPQDPDRQILIGAQGFMSWSRAAEIVSRDRKFWIALGDASAAGKRPYALHRAMGPNDEPVADDTAMRRELDRRVEKLEASFGSFYAR